MSAYGGNAAASAAQGAAPDEVAKKQPTQMTLDFETAPDPGADPNPGVNPKCR
jgi:hypothetical protein